MRAETDADYIVELEQSESQLQSRVHKLERERDVLRAALEAARDALKAAPCMSTTNTSARGLADMGSLYLKWYRDHNIGDYLPERPTQEMY